MNSQVLDDLFLAGDIANELDAVFMISERLAENLPFEQIDIYRAGLLAGLLAMAEMHGLNTPKLREAEAALKRRKRTPTRYDMKL